MQMIDNLVNSAFARTKKGYSIQSLAGIAIAFVVIAFTVSMGATILSDLQADQTADSYAYNVTGEGLESMETFGDWLPTLALVVIAAVIIGVLVFYLGRSARG